MELTWWGTAGFRFRSGDDVFLIDPYLTRNPKARPRIGMTAGDVRDGSHIFISHGHFDHLLDVAAIAGRTGARVHCDPVAAGTLTRQGLAPDRITKVSSDGQSFDFGEWQAKAFHAKHVKFDARLVLSTLAKVNFRLFGLRPLMKDYPCGQVLAWRFQLEGRSVLHFGSAGLSPEELRPLAAEPPDVLMVPLQGHTEICRIALEHVLALKPRIVIPHHQDDFYPPVSRMVDIRPFVEGVRREAPGTEVLTLEPERPVTL